ncbi:MAG: F0F1 ATP synthase subunit B family protein [Bdellovibrionota bacterium]
MISDLQRQLGIDASFFTQLLIFLLIFTWMQVVYFRPFLKLIQKRQGQSGGLSDDAARLEEAAARSEKEVQDAIAAARKKAALERERVLAEARAAANELIAAARSAAKTKLEQARESAQKSAEGELAGLRGQVSGMASLLVEKLTKTKVGL